MDLSSADRLPGDQRFHHLETQRQLIFGFDFSLLATGFQSKPSLTSRHLLHENLDEAVLADGAQVLDDVLVLEVLVQGDLLVERLRVSGNPTKRYKS